MTDKVGSSRKSVFVALTALVLLGMCLWFISGSNPHLKLSSLRGDASVHRALQEEKVSNKVTFLYVVGVEGVGHHGVAPALATIGRSCQNYVFYESQALRNQQHRMSSKNYVYQLNAKQNGVLPAPTNEILIVEDSSFPTNALIRHGDHGAKKAQGMYNLEWVYDNAKQADIDIKFLYLNRDFYRTVMSHPEFDGDYQTHAKVLHDFVGYINEEYQRIEAKESGLWRQINYEWFSPMENCTSLVTSLIDFIGWSECDVESACRTLQEDLRPPTKREVDKAARAFIEQFNVTLPIPMLNMTAGGEHQARPQRARTLKPSLFQRSISIPTSLRSEQEPRTAASRWRSQPEQNAATAYKRVHQESSPVAMHLRAAHKSNPAWNTHANIDTNRHVTRIGGTNPTRQQLQQV